MEEPVQPGQAGPWRHWTARSPGCPGDEGGDQDTWPSRSVRAVSLDPDSDTHLQTLSETGEQRVPASLWGVHRDCSRRGLESGVTWSTDALCRSGPCPANLPEPRAWESGCTYPREGGSTLGPVRCSEMHLGHSRPAGGGDPTCATLGASGSGATVLCSPTGTH